MPNGGGPIDLKSWLKNHPEISDEDFRFLVGHSLSSLRVPLTGIMGYLTMLADGEFKGEEQKIHRLLLEAVKKSIASVNDIISLKVAYDRQMRGVNRITGDNAPQKKVLHFEDDELLSSMYAVKFKQYGLDYVTYENPSNDPVDIVLREHPDLIIMSVIMPVKDGFLATSMLKQDERTKHIPLVFLTNLGQREDIAKGRGLGAVDYWVMAAHTPTDIVEKSRQILGLPKLTITTPPVAGPLPTRASHMPPYQSLPDDEAINQRMTRTGDKQSRSWIGRLFGR